MGLGSVLEDSHLATPRPVNETDIAAIARAATRNVSGGETLVLLLDNLSAGPAHDLFGRFRDTLWSAPVVWIAAGDGDRDGYLEPPADAFWDAVTWLEPLDATEAAELLQRRFAAARPGDPDVDAIERSLADLLALLGDATPREVIRAAAQLVDGGIADVQESSERIGRAHRAGGRSAAMLLAEMDQLGRPLHAGDHELLARMGMSRARIVQLLGRLRDAGLVVGQREGRRVLYKAVS